MSQVRILSPRPKTKPACWAGFVFGLGSRVQACEAGSAEAPAQATPERRPVGRAKRVNPVAPTKNQTCPLGRFCFWIGKPGSSLRSRFSRSVSAGNAGTAARRASKASKSCRPDQKPNLSVGQVWFLDWEAGFEPAKQVQPKRQRRQRRNGACRPRQTSENTSFSA